MTMGSSLRYVPQGFGDYVASFHWQRIPTGKTGDKTEKFMSRSHFLELLDLWNSDPRWKYWSKPS